MLYHIIRQIYFSYFLFNNEEKSRLQADYRYTYERQNNKSSRRVHRRITAYIWEKRFPRSCKVPTIN